MHSLLLALAALAAAHDPAAPRSDELIFPLQPKHVHSSSVVECPNGDLLCAWFHGSGERRSKDVVIEGARLRKGSDTWSDVFPMADTPNLPDCNPVLFIDPAQMLWLFWIAVPADRWEDSLLRFRKAKDYVGDGAPKWDWQDDLFLEPGEQFARTMVERFDELAKTVPSFQSDFGDYADKLRSDAWNPSIRQRGWMTRTHALVLPSGRIVLPLYSDGYLAGLCALSDDNGKSWRPSGPMIGMALNQPSIVRKNDGTLVAYLREENDIKHRILRCESKDDGETWSLATSTELPNPNASVEALRLQDGRWVLVYNDSETSRDTLAVSTSDDEGTTWKWTRHLEHAAGGAYHYPSIIQTRDGHIHITYTYLSPAGDGKSIKHVALSTEWLTGKD